MKAQTLQKLARIVWQFLDKKRLEKFSFTFKMVYLLTFSTSFNNDAREASGITSEVWPLLINLPKN